MEQTSGKDRMKELTWSFPNIGKKYPEHREEAENFCREYKTFLDNGKTERECAEISVRMLQEAGYVPYEAGKKYAPGDKVYYVNRGKALIAATFGQKKTGENLYAPR